MYYLNEEVKSLNRIFDQNKRDGYLRLDLNENPGGLPEEFIEEVLSEVTPELISKYPETLEFTEVLADFIGAEKENICLVNGSSEGIRNIMQAFSSPGGRVVGVVPTYAMFEVYSKMYGRKYIPVHYSEDLKITADDILKEMTPETELLIILNPNNPMGNVYSYEEMDRIVQKAAENEITILVDEAYVYFYPNEFLKYALENEHIFVTRTFSKLFSLAGLRLGYVVGWPEGVEMVQKLCTPHNVNAIAMLFAQKIIQKEGMLEETIAKQTEGKAYLIEQLIANGYKVNAKEGNFIFIQPKTDAKEVVRRMKEDKKILVKTYSGVGELGECLRVSTGEKEYMSRFIEALIDVDK